MNQQEFTQRTGYTPCTKEEWKAIEMMYLEAGESVDKDLFCEEWLKNKDGNLLRIFYERSVYLAEKFERFNELITETAKSLLDKNENLDDDEMYWLAVKLIEQKRAVRYKVNHGYRLNQHDIDYINDNLE